MARNRSRLILASLAMSAVLVFALAVVAVDLAPSPTKTHTSAGSLSDTTTHSNLAESSTASTSLFESTTDSSTSTCSSVTSAAVTSTSSSANGSAIFIAIGQPEACHLTLGGETFVSNETFPVTITSPQSTSIQLRALNVPQGVLVYFEPTTVTATPSGGVAAMTIAGAARPFTPVGGGSTMVIEADAGNLSVSLDMQLIVAPLSIVSSSSTPIALHEFQTNVNGSSNQTYGIVYDPSGSAPNSPFPVSFSITGMLVNGDVIALPSWLHLLHANRAFSLVPDRPIYFVMSSTVVSAPPGTYQLVVQENVGGSSYSTVMSLIVLAPVQLHLP